MRPELGRCWIWFGSTLTGGHGQFRSGAAHAFSYRLHKGMVPEGLEIDHLCRIRLCVNPSHLEAVTRRENLARGKSALNGFKRKEFCKQGHALDGNRTKANECRICTNARQRAWRRKQHAA